MQWIFQDLDPRWRQKRWNFIPQDALVTSSLLQDRTFSEELARFIPETWKHMVNVLPYKQAVEHNDDRSSLPTLERVGKRGIYLSILGIFSRLMV